jgi:hypothetical protein
MKSLQAKNHVLKQVQGTMANTKSRIRRVVNQQTPTAPMYDLPNNPPATAVEGQIAVDEMGKLWWYLDGEWRTC